MELSGLTGHLADVEQRLARGEEITLTQAGRPLAKLAPLDKPPPSASERSNRHFGALRGRIWMAADFDGWPPGLDAAFRGDPG
ncbi:MAG: type II toxin-antitoxin system prevent-host-death family antitoxin [Candidatus Dormibacteraeota bacterium]|nr:type II toxin-antitoxin system prevent-host-death family antitoxin [Candidatus Dormibacteraeota bacterium]